MRKSAQLLLASAMAAVGANAAAVAAVAAAAPPVKTPRGGKEQNGARGPVDPYLCGREAAECADDTECGGCLAIAIISDERETAELPGVSSSGGGEGSGGAGSSRELFYGIAPPATRCENIGTTVCHRFTVAAVQEDERDWRRAEICLNNHLVQALLTCRVRTASCEPDDAPCIMPEQPRRRGLSSSPGGITYSDIARSAPRPLSDDTERGRRAQAWPAVVAAAAAAAADVRANADAFDPEWAPRHQRRLATSSEATCNGIQGVNACCSSDCGECGGSGCSTRGGGAEHCCRTNIEDSGILCSDTGGAAPCIVDGKARTSRGDCFLLDATVILCLQIKFRISLAPKTEAVRCLTAGQPFM